MLRSRTVLIGTLLALGLSTGAFAQTVIQSVAVQVKPGKLDTYMERIASLQGVLDRVAGGAKVTVWQATLAGTNTGSTLVGIAYPSLAAFAEGQTKTAADPEWQKIIGGLDDIRTLASTSLLRSLDGGGLPADVPEGAVMQAVVVRVNPGQLDAYLGRIEELKKAQARVGASATTRVWQFTLAGEASGSLAVAVQHPSLAAYADNTAKFQADAAATKIFDGLDDLRTLVSASLYRKVGP